VFAIAGTLFFLMEKFQKHVDLALNPHLAIDIPNVCLDSSRLDIQGCGDPAVSKSSTHQFCNF